MQTVWLSPTDYVTGDSSLRISYPSVSHPSTIVTSKTTGDFKWISMGLNLPENITIEGDGTRFGLDVWDTNLYRSGTDTLKTDDEFVSAVGFTIGTQRIKNGAGRPLAGTWSVGDIVYNTTPIAGGFIGWVCIVSGTPGTWKAFGPIEA